MIRKEQAIQDGLEAVTDCYVNTFVRDCPEGYQKEEYSVLFNIFIMNAAEGCKCISWVWAVCNQEVLCASGCWGCEVHKQSINGRLTHINAKFLKS